jgi:YD repeat-containing protein
LGRVSESRLYLAGVPAVSRTAYDAYGNTIAQTDAEGRSNSKVYGGFGRLLQDFDEDGIQVAYSYDVFGRIVREFDPNGAKDLRKSYDEAGRLLSIQDLATGVSTL